MLRIYSTVTLVSAFTFLNFVLAAGSVAANIISNVNDNNNNNNVREILKIFYYVNNNDNLLLAEQQQPK